MTSCDHCGKKDPSHSGEVACYVVGVSQQDFPALPNDPEKVNLGYQFYQHIDLCQSCREQVVRRVVEVLRARGPAASGH